VNATCDNYFGQTPYPTAQTNADEIIVVDVAAGGAGGGSSPPPVQTPVPVDNGGGVAVTGNDTQSELGIGISALVLGSLLVLIGRKRAVAVRSGAYGRTVARPRS
jgi:hypothetical protein